MRPVRDGVLLAVEVTAPGIRVLRVAGDLDDAAAGRVKALAAVLLGRVVEESARTRSGSSQRRRAGSVDERALRFTSSVV